MIKNKKKNKKKQLVYICQYIFIKSQLKKINIVNYLYFLFILIDLEEEEESDLIIDARVNKI